MAKATFNKAPLAVPRAPDPILYVLALAFIEFVAAFWVFDWIGRFFWSACPPQLTMAFAAVWTVGPFRRWISSCLNAFFPAKFQRISRAVSFVMNVAETGLWLLISIVKSVLHALLIAISVGLIGAILFVGPYHLFQNDTRLGIAALCVDAIVGTFILCCCCRGK